MLLNVHPISRGSSAPVWQLHRSPICMTHQPAPVAESQQRSMRLLKTVRCGGLGSILMIYVVTEIRVTYTQYSCHDHILVSLSYVFQTHLIQQQEQLQVQLIIATNRLFNR